MPLDDGSELALRNISISRLECGQSECDDRSMWSAQATLEDTIAASLQLLATFLSIIIVSAVFWIGVVLQACRMLCLKSVSHWYKRLCCRFNDDEVEYTVFSEVP